MKENLKSNIKNRLGERRTMKCGEECEIVEYREYLNITVRFIKTGELIKSTYDNFKNKSIKSHFTPTVYGVGVVGLERTRMNGKQLKSYQTWKSMLGRCYDEKCQQKQPTYKDCSICEEWLYYKNFKQWYDENYYDVNGEIMNLDKDILVKGNKIYSPENCVFAPQNINKLFIKSNAVRGKLPIGVKWHKRDRVYESACSVFDLIANKNKDKYLGRFSTSQEAFQVYKKIKEENIKQVADIYKEYIPSKLYEAMYGYEVEIDD